MTVSYPSMSKQDDLVYPEDVSAEVVDMIIATFHKSEVDAIRSFMSTDVFRRVMDDDDYARTDPEMIFDDYLQEIRKEVFGPVLTTADITALKITVIKEYSELHSLKYGEVLDMFSEKMIFPWMEEFAGLLCRSFTSRALAEEIGARFFR